MQDSFATEGCVLAENLFDQVKTMNIASTHTSRTLKLGSGVCRRWMLVVLKWFFLPLGLLNNSWVVGWS